VCIYEEGNWKSGKPEGFGTLKTKTGRIEAEGMFQSGELVTSTTVEQVGVGAASSPSSDSPSLSEGKFSSGDGDKSHPSQEETENMNINNEEF